MSYTIETLSKAVERLGFWAFAESPRQDGGTEWSSSRLLPQLYAGLAANLATQQASQLTAGLAADRSLATDGSLAADGTHLAGNPERKPASSPASTPLSHAPIRHTPYKDWCALKRQSELLLRT